MRLEKCWFCSSSIVSRSLLIHRARSFDDVFGNPLVKDSYDAVHETERKRALSALLSQTKQQERKDAESLAEAKLIMESRAASKKGCLDMMEKVVRQQRHKLKQGRPD